ncbi:MAG: AEC family transporter [Deltaproteobacteria bacterium]|nr:AEC family transporter [Deltaproteobacteria bacterium]
MEALIEPILPIFLVILLGCFVKKSGFLNEGTLGEINRFIFNFPLPVLVFTGVAHSNFEGMNFKSFFAIMIPTFLTLLLSLISGKFLKLSGGKLGTFLQASIHGNVSYVGLATILFTLGESSLKKGTFFVGFLILLNNAIAILSLHLTSRNTKDSFYVALSSILKTPVIWATFLGLFFAAYEISLPSFILKTMNILSNVALPMALIVIGATMKWDFLTDNVFPLILASIFKLFVLPVLCIPLLNYFRVPIEYGVPLIILLASPVAISSYVMARELDGDARLASGAITLSTLLSPLAFILWRVALGVS